MKLLSRLIGFAVPTLTPFRKFFKHLAKLINQGNTRVIMAWITNSNYCSNGPQEEVRLGPQGIMGRIIKLSFLRIICIESSSSTDLQCTINFSCKEALNRPRLPFLPLLLSSYLLIINTRREMSYLRVFL